MPRSEESGKFTKELTFDDIVVLFANGEVQFVTVMDASGQTKSFNLSRKKENGLARQAVEGGLEDDEVLGWCASKTLEWLQDVKPETNDEDEAGSLGAGDFDGEIDFGEDNPVGSDDDVDMNDADGNEEEGGVDPLDEADASGGGTDDSSDGGESRSSSRCGAKTGRSSGKNQQRANSGGGGKPTQSKATKGTSRHAKKHTSNESDDSDSESELGLEDEGVMSSFNKMLQQNSHGSVEVIVSHPFIDRKQNIVHWKVVLGIMGPVWYLKYDFLRDIITVLRKRKGEPLPKAIESLHEISVRKEEYGEESVYRRRKPTPKNMKGGTLSRIAFNIELPLVSQSLFNSHLNESLELIFGVMKQRKKNNAGELILQWAGNESGQGLYGYLLTQKGGPMKSTEEAARTMNEEIQHVFSNGYTVSWHNPLDRLLVDFDIKEFLANEVGYNSWKDLPNSEKGHVFKNDKSKKKLPDWDAIRKEPF